MGRKSELAATYRLRASRLRNESRIAETPQERDALLELAYHWESLPNKLKAKIRNNCCALLRRWIADADTARQWDW
jgi:hypothetical protein